MNEHNGKQIVDVALLGDYSEWLAANPGLTLALYARPAVSIDHFFAIGSLLWPEIKAHEGGLFLADGFTTSNFDLWYKQTSGNLTAVERVINHRHMRNMLKSLDDASAAILMSAGNLVRDCWSGRLRQMFPETALRVELISTSTDVEVTFFTLRPTPM